MKLTTQLSRFALPFTRFAATPIGLTTYTFVALYLAAIYYVRGISSRDPGSWFFDPSTAYTPQYAAERLRQAENYIVAASNSPPFKRTRGEDVRLCVGVPSIARDGARYLRTTVGSLLNGLTQSERDGIHLTVFIPHTNPAVHPAYNETWLASLADEILQYNLSQSQLEHIASLEVNDESFREKGLFDYTYLLKACSETGAPYVAILEDDVIAMDGWYHRTLGGIQQAEVKSSRERGSADFLYLRLFYTEEFLGWNSEDWQAHAFWSLCFLVASASLLFSVRFYFPNVKRHLTPHAMLAICGLPIPLIILLFFAAGKVTTLPLPAGVNEMNKYGCCSQGLVFPRHKVQELIEWLDASHVGFVDVLTEQYADQHHELRWALTPSVIQHIGQKSSKVDDFGSAAKYNRSVAQKVWNFAFELNDVATLRNEHISAAQTI